MKKLVLFVLFLLNGAFVFAQQQSQPTPPPAPPATPATVTPPLTRTLAETLKWLQGDWKGSGVSRSEHEFIAEMKVQSDLDDFVLLFHRESKNKPGGPTGGLKELMVLGYNRGTNKVIGTVYDNNSVIDLYVGELKEGELVLSSSTLQQGYTLRRVIRKINDKQMTFAIESGSPGKEVIKNVEIAFKKD